MVTRPRHENIQQRINNFHFLVLDCLEFWLNLMIVSVFISESRQVGDVQNPEPQTRLSANARFDTLSLNLPVYWVEIFQNVTQNLLSQNYVNLLHIHHTQSSVQKTITMAIKRRTSISFVDDVILYSLKNIRQKLRNMSLKSFFSFCFHLTRNCKRTLNFLPLTRGLFPFSRSL